MLAQLLVALPTTLHEVATSTPLHGEIMIGLGTASRIIAVAETDLTLHCEVVGACA